METGNFPIPSELDIQECFLRFLFGSGESFLVKAIRLAYGDVCRTMKGIADHDPDGRLRAKAVELLHDRLKDVTAYVRNQKTFDKVNQHTFDAWHQATCDALIELYHSDKFGNFFVGQAQKWINMAVKYCALLGDRAMPSGRSLFSVGHVPIDGYVIKQLSGPRFGLPKALQFDAWSRVDSYDRYMEFQFWVREKFAPSLPLAVEFYLWQQYAGSDVPAT